ncbi:MAG: PASTA domain-containing protein [Coriobacteriia bacterium]|nr:PASTA domain-containing protein [Coriobacteriia bacterium]
MSQPVPQSKADLLRLAPLQRERPLRDKLLTGEALIRLLLWTLSAACCAAYIVVASWAYAQVTVPDLFGMSEDAAAVVLQQEGLQLRVVGARASAQPVGEVVQQRPAYGQIAQRGQAVDLVLSSGRAGFIVPDVLGEDQIEARLQFERLGMQVEIRQLQSESTPGTVLLTLPVAGTRVIQSDAENPEVAILYVATQRGSSGLVDYHLNGLRVVIEPRYTTTAYGDVSFDVARRLSSLFEAAGAQVTITRSSRERDVSLSEYGIRAAQAQPQLHIILSIGSDNNSGAIVRAAVEGADSTGTMVFQGLLEDLEDASFQRVAYFGQANADKAVEIVLGSTSSTTDIGNFAETFWRDRIARSIYMAAAPQFSFGSR